jgi:metal-responsive CopG/Arc/MetJ family transcriptional regulator
MAKHKASGDRHKPRRMTSIPEALAVELDKIANEEFNSLAEQVKVAVREYLDKRGRLPKPKHK